MASNASLSSSPTAVSFLAYDTEYEEICRDNGTNSRSPSDENSGSGPIKLAEFIDALPPIIHRQKENGRKSLQERVKQDALRGTKDDPVNALFSRLDLNLGEWKKYALFDSMKNYTRNLIATDNETFTLLLLCWNPNKESPIHDHPCGEYSSLMDSEQRRASVFVRSSSHLFYIYHLKDGCWLRVCQGKIQETRYEINNETDEMDVTSDEVFGGESRILLAQLTYHADKEQ